MLVGVLIGMLCLIWVNPVVVAQSNSLGFPVCSSNIYHASGMLDIDATLYNCSSNIPGSQIIRSYVPSPTGDTSPVNVSLAVKINNLVKVDDITSEVQMGFFLRLQWHDERWFMPDLFANISKQATYEGLDITGYIRNQNPLNMWLPDIVFYEATEMEVIAEFIRLFPDGKIYWSRNLKTSVQQSQNLLYNYPMDGQNYSLTFQSYSYETEFLRLDFMSNPVVFRYNNQYSKNAVDLNQLWSFKSYSYYVENVNSPAVFNPNRQYASAYVNLRFERQSFGVVFRLALPVAMFMLIVGFSFWSDIEKRLDISVQMLLIVTALYLIIGTVIPFVGYLTTMDRFMSVVFICLSLVIGVHVVTLDMTKRVDTFPMSTFYADIIVLFFKVCWLPATIALYQSFFEVGDPLVTTVLWCFVIACGAQCYFEFDRLRESFKLSLIGLRKKEEKMQSMLHKRNSGRLSGHEHHLIEELSRSEVLVLRLTRNIYKSKERMQSGGEESPAKGEPEFSPPDAVVGLESGGIELQGHAVDLAGLSHKALPGDRASTPATASSPYASVGTEDSYRPASRPLPPTPQRQQTMRPGETAYGGTPPRSGVSFRSRGYGSNYDVTVGGETY